MKLSLKEAYERFPLEELTMNEAQKWEHIDFFESDDEDYALKRLVNSATSVRFNVAVWLPPEKRCNVSAATLEAAQVDIGQATAWTCQPHIPEWNMRRHVDGDPTVYECGVSKLPEQIMAQNTTVADHMIATGSKLKNIANANVVACQLRAEDTREHFATGNNEICAPHVDLGRRAIRVLEYFHGEGSYIVPGPMANGIETNNETYIQTVNWAKADGSVISPLLVLPERAVVCMNAVGFIHPPVIHGTAIDKMVNGEPQRSKRLLGVYEMQL